MELSTYYICLLRQGPKWTSEKSAELDELQARHQAHIRSLVASGAKIAAGPVEDESDIHGFSIFRTATLDEARALAEADPAVQAGRFIVELHAWRTPTGGVLPPPMSGGEEER
ncbi:MAG: YciI family protein [Ktedonobacterales bacterium]